MNMLVVPLMLGALLAFGGGANARPPETSVAFRPTATEPRPGESGAVSDDPPPFEGDWKVMRLTLAGIGDGDLSPEEAEAEGFCWNVENGVVTIFRGGRQFGGQMEIDLVTQDEPKAMDLIMKEGAAKGRRLLAIYELDGDTIRIRYSIRMRPASLETPRARGEVDWTLERVKKP